MSFSEGTFPDDELLGDIAGASQKEKRRNEIIKWFDDFKAYCLEEGGLATDYDPIVVDQLNQNYWEEMCESVRARIVSTSGKPVRADRHKIASLLELLIVYYQPFRHDDPACQNDLNARAGFFVATNIIGNWGKVSTDDLFVSESFDREHRTWLMQLNHHSEGKPIFSNAATWYMVEKLFIERSGRAAS